MLFSDKVGEAGRGRMGIVGDFLVLAFFFSPTENTAFILRTQLGETTKAIISFARIWNSGTSNL